MNETTLPENRLDELGVPGFRYADLFEPRRLADLSAAFERYFAEQSPAHHATFAAYRACHGQGMTPLARSEALLAAAPYVGRFLGQLFRIERPLDEFRELVQGDDPLWRFRKEFTKKRVLRPDAGKGWTYGAEMAEVAAKAALQAMTPAPIGGTTDEERTIANATLPLLEVDDVARRAAKAGGAQWSDELRGRARAVRAALGAAGLAEVAVEPNGSGGQESLATGCARNSR